MLHLLFLLSGISGLVYQVVWVRTFGNVFGNTIYSASMVVAVFMLGLGAGGYAVGVWADRRYAARPESLLRAYGVVELVIAALGLGISLLLPQLDRVSAAVSSYVVDGQGWNVLSTGSYVSRAAIAVALLTPITLLMGGTLTLLIRHLVRGDVEADSRKIAVLYGVNTAGAALGCLLTDFSFVPEFGLFNTQLIAITLNALAGVGALALAGRHKAQGTRLKAQSKSQIPNPKTQPGTVDRRPETGDRRNAQTAFVAAALLLSGFAALGLEILWFRHFTMMLGQFRAVFSLLLAIILAGIGAGAFAAGLVQRRHIDPARWFMGTQAMFVVCALGGLYLADSTTIDASIQAGLVSSAGVGDVAGGALAELWFNARPMLLEVAIPALLMGFSFPLANAIVQQAERSVGRRAGLLYLANTAGAVAGSLVTGFLLLPVLGIQGSATVLAIAAALAIVPLAFSGQPAAGSRQEVRTLLPAASCLLPATAAIVFWWLLPADHVMQRALPPLQSNERLLAIDEGVNEVISVTEAGTARTLMTNGHPMSSTGRMSQRYMRALAHVPLLSIDAPQRALVIGFGVGNTTHAVTLHPSIKRVDLADLSRDILNHAGYFSAFNRDVLRDPRVAVYVNDGRQHLQMQPASTYDLVTLEPPPIGYAGVAALYSREFYELAKSRLKTGGYMSQWLPAYQVPTATTLAMVRAFVDVFPGAVLVSGAESELLLFGVNGARATLDPARLAANLSRAPAVREDLERFDLGSPTEIAGMFVGSAETLASATAATPPVTDDRPIQEYGVMSLLDFGEAVPGAVVRLEDLASWCPTCFEGGRPAAAVGGLDAYMALMRIAYSASPAEVRRARAMAEQQGREIAGSAYLGAIVPETAEVHNALGISLASAGRMDAAIAEFRRAAEMDPGQADTHWHLGAALAAVGAFDEAALQLQRAVEIDPGHSAARSDLTSVLALRTQRRGGAQN